jgi:DNA-binding transcriptional LysR family regulator
LEDAILELKDLTVFAEVARCGSFTGAADKLHISTAAVSRAIARLENQLATRLFNRSTRRLSLTEDGRSYLAGIREGLASFEKAEQALRVNQRRAFGTLKVLLPNTFCKNYLMPFLPQFMRDHPDIVLDLHVDDFGIDLLEGGFEVSVQFGKPPEKNYIFRSLGSVQVILVASPDYLERMGTPRSIDDLSRHECINVKDFQNTTFPWHFRRIVEGAPSGETTICRPKGRFFVNSQIDTVVNAALHGLGISPIDMVVAERFLREGLLKAVLPDYEIISGGELFLLYPHRDHVPLRCRAFIDFIVEVAQKTLVRRSVSLPT